MIQKVSESKDYPEVEIKTLLGQKAAELFQLLSQRLTQSYPKCEPVYKKEGKDKTHVIRYRQGGKTLVTFYPGHHLLKVLIVLGKKELAKAEKVTDRLSPNIKNSLSEAPQYHDGRWLWLELQTMADLESVILLLSTKRKPIRSE
ncbi:DUF3788 family protein [bacterium]|nr:DUF3788 family protein [bacterium]